MLLSILCGNISATHFRSHWLMQARVESSDIVDDFLWVSADDLHQFIFCNSVSVDATVPSFIARVHQYIGEAQ